MKKPLRNRVIMPATRFKHLKVALVAGLLLFASCVTDDLSDLPTEDVKESPMISLEEVVFHTGTYSYLVPQNDPYALANIQKAYDMLASGNSMQAITRSQANEFSGTAQLEPTHYSLKIYPKNENEQWEIELLENIAVSYIPFNYVQLPEEVVEKMHPVTRSDTAVYPETNPYVVVYENLETIDGPVESETYVMPIMYATWPIDMPLPEDVDYEIDYAVFIPPYKSDLTRSSSSTSALSEDALHILENEAIGLALGISPPSRAATRSGGVTYTGTIEGWDSFLETGVPLANLRIRFQLGSNIWDTYTQSNGHFGISAPIPANASYIHMFQHSDWKITHGTTTTPYSVNWYTVDDWWTSTATDHYMRPGGWPPAYEILPAVDLYFNGAHSIRKFGYGSGIRIAAMNTTSDTALASFHYSKRDPAYIKVFNNAAETSNTFIGAILHEFGHFSHFGERGLQTGSAYDGFRAVHSLITESFAEYAGWYMGVRYYALKRYNPVDTFDLTGCFAQRWTRTKTGSNAWYSPLFVDLIDNYNQNTLSSSYNPDPISGVSHVAIRAMAAECTTWASLKTKLQSYVGVFYTQTELDTYLAPYNYWFANN